MQLIDGQPWFVLGDLCRVLDIGNPSEVRRRLAEADLSSTEVRSGGQRRQVTVVNEPGLYDLILDSRKPGARRFRRWVTAEVLPALRRGELHAQQPVQQQRELSRKELIVLALEAEEAREVAELRTDNRRVK